MNFIHSIYSSHELLGQITLFMFIAITLILGVLVILFSYRAEKFEKLYNYTNKEARLMARLKAAYEKELRGLAGIMDEITFPVWQRDKNLNIIYCNRRYCEITGEIRENIIKKGNIELFRDARDFAQKAIKTSHVQVMEQNIVISGSNTLNQVVEIPTVDTSSRFSSKSGTVGFALNFAELQNTRERLRSSVELQKRLLGSLHAAVAIYGANQRLEYYNNSFVDLWKLDEDHLKTLPSYGDILETLRTNRRLPEQADFAGFKRDNIKMFDNLINPKEDFYYLADGRVIKVVIIPYQNRGLLFYYEDMTNAITLERNYNTVVSVQRQTLDNLKEAVAVFREDGKLELYNPIFRDLWGFTENFLKSEPHISKILEELAGLYSSEDEAEYRENFISIINSRTHTERKTTRLDGITLIESFTPLPDGATLIIYSDITDKANLEKSIIAEKKAYEEADRIKTGFLGNVSYELRSPLTSIMGFSEILLHLHSASLDKKVKEYISDIHDSSQKLKLLIDNIIDVSTIDSGFVSLETEEMHISKLMEPLGKALESDAAKHSMKFELSIDKKVDRLIADSERLSHSIRSLFNHSLNMSKKGDVVKLDITRQDNKVHFEIIDHGIGIGDAEFKLIFEQFYKLRSGRSSNLALSLYLSKKIVDMHGGSLDVKSEPGKGTRFIIEIPASYN